MSAPPVFCCHATLDKPVVVPLVEAMVASGISVWLDAWEIAQGESWQMPLMRALHRTDVAVLFIGPNGLGRVQTTEWGSFRNRSTCAVLPVCLPGAPWAIYDFQSSGPTPLVLDRFDEHAALILRVLGLRRKWP